MTNRIPYLLVSALAAAALPALAHGRPDAVSVRPVAAPRIERAASVPRIMRQPRPVVQPRMEPRAMPRVVREPRTVVQPRMEPRAMPRVVREPRTVVQPRMEPRFIRERTIVRRTFIGEPVRPRVIVRERFAQPAIERVIYANRPVTTVLVPTTTTQFVAAAVVPQQVIEEPIAMQPVLDLNAGFSGPAYYGFTPYYLAAPPVTTVAYNPYYGAAYNDYGNENDCDNDDGYCGGAQPAYAAQTALYPVYAGYGNPFGNAQLQGVVVANTGSSLVVLTPNLQPVFVDAAPAQTLGYVNGSLQSGALVDAFGYYNGNTFVATAIE